MNDLDLARRLRQLRRTVDMLQTDLRRGHLNDELLANIDHQLERGIGTEPRSEKLRTTVDSLRESTLASGPGLYTDPIRACDKLKHAIEGVLSGMR